MAPTKESLVPPATSSDAVAALLQTTADARRTHLQSGVSEVAKSLALLLLACVVAVAFFRGLPIHYVTDSGPGRSQPGVVPEAMAIDFAVRWVKARYTFTPSTFKGQIAEVVRWVHPTLRLRFQKEAEEEERDVRKSVLSSQVYIPDPFVLARGRPARCHDAHGGRWSGCGPSGSGTTPGTKTSRPR